MTRARDESVVAGESQKARVEAHQVALMFGDSGCQIIEPELASTAVECFERMDVAADKRLKILAVRELQINLSAVAFL